MTIAWRAAAKTDSRLRMRLGGTIFRLPLRPWGQVA